MALKIVGTQQIQMRQCDRFDGIASVLACTEYEHRFVFGYEISFVLVLT